MYLEELDYRTNRSMLLILYTREMRPVPFVRHALWTKYMRIIRSHQYGYEFTDKAIVENYNKSVGNTYRRALVIAS